MASVHSFRHAPCLLRDRVSTGSARTRITPNPMHYERCAQSDAQYNMRNLCSVRPYSKQALLRGQVDTFAPAPHRVHTFWHSSHSTHARIALTQRKDTNDPQTKRVASAVAHAVEIGKTCLFCKIANPAFCWRFFLFTFRPSLLHAPVPTQPRTHHRTAQHAESYHTT